jgi:hypothetical protein
VADCLADGCLSRTLTKCLSSYQSARLANAHEQFVGPAQRKLVHAPRLVLGHLVRFDDLVAHGLGKNINTRRGDIDAKGLRPGTTQPLTAGWRCILAPSPCDSMRYSS